MADKDTFDMDSLKDTSSLSKISGQDFSGSSHAEAPSSIFNRSSVDRALDRTGTLSNDDYNRSVGMASQAKTFETEDVEKNVDPNKRRGLTDAQLKGIAAGAEGAGEFVTGFMNLMNARDAMAESVKFQEQQLADMETDLSDYMSRIRKQEKFDKFNSNFIKRMQKEALNNQLMAREIAKEQKKRARQQSFVNGMRQMTESNENYRDFLANMVGTQRGR